MSAKIWREDFDSVRSTGLAANRRAGRKEKRNQAILSAPFATGTEGNLTGGHHKLSSSKSVLV